MASRTPYRKSEGGAATLQTVDAGHAPEECQQLPLDREPVLRRESASPEEQKQGADEQAGRGRDDREQAGREQQAERPKRVRRAALPTTATPSARQKAHYADAQERLVELKAKPFFTTLVVAAMLAVAREFTEPKTFGDIKGLPDHSEWINACHEELLQFESKRVWEPFPRSSLPPRARVLPCQYVFALKKPRRLNQTKGSSSRMWELGACHGPGHVRVYISGPIIKGVLCQGCVAQAQDFLFRRAECISFCRLGPRGVRHATSVG